MKNTKTKFLNLQNSGISQKIILLLAMISLSLLLVACAKTAEPEITIDAPQVVEEQPVVQEVVKELPPEPDLEVMTLGNVPNKCAYNEQMTNNKKNFVVSNWPNAIKYAVITCNSYTGSDEEQRKNADVNLYLVEFASQAETTGAYIQSTKGLTADDIPVDLAWIEGTSVMAEPKHLSLGADALGVLYTVENDQGELLKIFETYSYKETTLIYAKGVTTYRPYSSGFMATFYPTTELLMNGFVRSTYLLQ